MRQYRSRRQLRGLPCLSSPARCNRSAPQLRQQIRQYLVQFAFYAYPSRATRSADRAPNFFEVAGISSWAMPGGLSVDDGIYDSGGRRAEGIGYTIRLPANRVLQERIGYLLKCPVGRPPYEVRR